MGEGTGGREVWWCVCGHSLLVASVLSVKQETRSLAESEDGGGGFWGLRREEEEGNCYPAELKSEGTWDVWYD